MSSSSYKLNHKAFMNQPLEELAQLFPETQPDAKPTEVNRWSRFNYEQSSGVTLHHVELIEALFAEHRVNQDPWGDPLELKDRRLNLLPSSQRARDKTFAVKALEKHTPDLFYERWLPWIESALKESYIDAKEKAEAAGKQLPNNLYSTLRRVSLKVVARTVCASFKGSIIPKIEAALEGIDTAYARIAFGGKRSRFGLFTSGDVKLAQQSVKSLETTIRPLIRERIGGVSLGDDLISRWVNTRGQDGRSPKEDQIIDQVMGFLTMGYSSLPKLLFGAIYALSDPKQDDFVSEMRKELNSAVKLITNPPIFDDKTPAPVTPQNESAWLTLPLHHTVVLESLRLYPPQWISQLRLDSGVFLLGDEQGISADGPTIDSSQQIWASAMALHQDPEYFTKPYRFWPQRWSGNLESRLPRYAFAPFGFEGNPCLSELYCNELATRFLMLWCARYMLVDAPSTVRWELSLCLRPVTSISWGQRKELEQKT